MDFLVGRLELFVRGVLLLDHRLEVIFRRRELLLELLHLIVRRVRRRRSSDPETRRDRYGLMEEHQEPTPAGGRAVDRHDFDIDGPRFAVALDPHVVLANGAVFLFRARDRRADRRQQPLAEHLDETQRRLPGERGQIGTRVAMELEDLEFFCDQNAGRGIAREQDPIRFPLGGFAAPRLGSHRRRHLLLTIQPRPLDQRRRQPVGGGLAAVKPVFGVDGFE